MGFFDDAVLAVYVMGWLMANFHVPVGKRFNHTGLKIMMTCEVTILVRHVLTHSIVDATIDAGSWRSSSGSGGTTGVGVTSGDGSRG